mmetsp:Transcript_77313/g.121755  ORF Transcript_77313/g.121755 Transcript_77313/m.121755 type:complete len:202 (+) Transcript_77313:1022-1627(+)
MLNILLKDVQVLRTLGSLTHQTFLNRNLSLGFCRLSLQMSLHQEQLFFQERLFFGDPFTHVGVDLLGRLGFDQCLGGFLKLLVNCMTGVLLLGRLICPVTVTPICHADVLPQLRDLGLSPLRFQVHLIVLLSHICQDSSHLLDGCVICRLEGTLRSLHELQELCIAAASQGCLKPPGCVAAADGDCAILGHLQENNPNPHT